MALGDRRMRRGRRSRGPDGPRLEEGVGPGEEALSTEAAEIEDDAVTRGPAAGDGADTDLRGSAAGGVKWSFVSNMTRQGGRVLFTLVLARLIGPEDFGIVSQATVYIAFTQLLLDQGFGTALVQRRNLDRADVASVFWLNAASVVVMVAATLLLAPAVAAFFRTEELTAVLRVLSISVMVKGLSVVPLATLTRGLRFRELALAEVAGVVIGGFAGIVAALSGLEYWSLVVQTTVTDLLILAGLFAVAGRPPLHGSWQRLRGMFTFSRNVMATQFLLYAGRNADNALVGRYLGPIDLAYYAISYRFLTLPLQMLGHVVSRVALPVFSRLQHDRTQLRRWYLTANVSMATMGFPVLTLMILGAPEGVLLVFGAEWAPAILPLQILTFCAFRQIAVKLPGPLFLSLGRSDLDFRIAVVTVATIITSFVVGLKWGIVGVAIGYAIANYLTAPLTFWFAHRLIDLDGRDYARAMAPPHLSCLGMVAAWTVVHLALTPLGLPVVVRLAVGSVAAVAAYLAMYRVLWPDRFAESRRIATQVARGRTPTPVSA